MERGTAARGDPAEDSESERMTEDRKPTTRGPVHALVIAAHPDDAEFGAAGTVAGWTAEGKRVAYVVCTSGEKGSGDRDVDPAELARTREQEQLDAATVAGVVL